MGTGSAILGRTLAGRFRVVGFIGEGAMASVYRAVQEAEPHDVALKIMHPHLVNDATFAGRFRREARAASRIVHPNTVRIVDTGSDGNLLYIAMELLAGQDLFETLVLDRRLAEERAVNILVQVADALVAAHEKGVVHRDLKPENIMLLRDEDSAREDVKVLDFGIAKILEADVPSGDGAQSMHSALTGVGTVVGTPAYMSPEQCRGEPIDTRSDVYACGILLYQLVCGRLPFASQNAMDLAVMHVRTPPTPPEQIVPGIHRDLSAIILKALGKWPAQRQQTAAELRDALRALQGRLSPTPLEVSASAPPLPTPPTAPAPVTLGNPAGVPQTPPEAPREFADDVKTLDPSPGLKVPPDPASAPDSALPSSEPARRDSTPKPKPVPNPVAAPLKVRSASGPASTRDGLGSWLIVPLALLLGIAMGALAFFLSRR